MGTSRTHRFAVLGRPKVLDDPGVSGGNPSRVGTRSVFSIAFGWRKRAILPTERLA